MQTLVDGERRLQSFVELYVINLKYQGWKFDQRSTSTITQEFILIIFFFSILLLLLGSKSAGIYHSLYFSIHISFIYLFIYKLRQGQIGRRDLTELLF